MKTTRLFALALIVVGLGAGVGIAPLAPAHADEPVPPRPAGPVLDRADVLSPAEEQSLTARIETGNRQGHAKVAVLTMPSVDGSLDRWSDRVATAWGVGEQGKDNGVLIVLDLDARKVRMSVADGVRPRLSDSTADDIIDDDMVPSFKRDRWAEGLDRGVEAVYTAAATPPRPRTLADRVGPPLVVGGLLAAVAAGIIAIVRASARARRTRLAAAERHLAEIGGHHGDGPIPPHLRQQYLGYVGRTRMMPYGVWIGHYLTSPAQYGATAPTSTSSSSSSYTGGGGFSGGGASGSF